MILGVLGIGVIAGHSLGGFLASVVTIELDPDISKCACRPGAYTACMFSPSQSVLEGLLETTASALPLIAAAWPLMQRQGRHSCLGLPRMRGWHHQGGVQANLWLWKQGA